MLEFLAALFAFLPTTPETTEQAALRKRKQRWANIRAVAIFIFVILAIIGFILLVGYRMGQTMKAAGQTTQQVSP